MKTYTLCGSMRFEKEMKEIACLLETQHCFNILQCTIRTKRLQTESWSSSLRHTTEKSISAMGSML